MPKVDRDKDICTSITNALMITMLMAFNASPVSSTCDSFMSDSFSSGLVLFRREVLSPSVLEAGGSTMENNRKLFLKEMRQNSQHHDLV